MAAIGRKLYISEYIRNSNTSVLYHNLTTNPFQEQKPVVLARGPGRLKSVFLYHKSLMTPGMLLLCLIICSQHSTVMNALVQIIQQLISVMISLV